MDSSCANRTKWLKAPHVLKSLKMLHSKWVLLIVEFSWWNLQCIYCVSITIHAIENFIGLRNEIKRTIESYSPSLKPFFIQNMIEKVISNYILNWSITTIGFKYGTKFLTICWMSCASTWNLKHIPTFAYHPKCNDASKQFSKTIAPLHSGASNVLINLLRFRSLGFRR